jgi:hypothetical protein
VASSLREPHFQEQLALYTRRESLELIAAWAPGAVRTVLKTDLVEEGFGKDALGHCVRANGAEKRERMK